MRPHLLIYMFLLCAMVRGQMSHGFELGANLMNADFNIENVEVDAKNAVGPRAGYVGEYHITDALFLRGALLYMQKGFKFAEETWAVNSFDLPVSIGYAFDLNGDKLQWFIDGGASLEYNTRAITRIDDEPVELIIGKEEGDIKSLSSGISFGTGLQFARLIKLRVNYYQGLTNMINTTTSDTWKNRYLGLSLNFIFRK